MSFLPRLTARGSLSLSLMLGGMSGQGPPWTSASLRRTPG